MIPKVIHYCWFGEGKLSDLALKCIESWKKYFPDYEIKQWNENNYNVNKISYIKEAYEAKKYAFVSDYARFDILYHEGGIYFDTDVEVIKKFDQKLLNSQFMGCEKDGTEKHPGNTVQGIAVNPGLGMAVAPGLDIYKEILDFYEELHFLMDDGNLNTKTVVQYTTEILRAHGLKNIKGIQCIEGITVYPKEYFCPKDYVTGELCCTENTYTIHHYSESWHSKIEKKMTEMRQYYLKKYGLELGQKKYAHWCRRNFIFIVIGKHGFFGTIRTLIKHIKLIK